MTSEAGGIGQSIVKGRPTIGSALTRVKLSSAMYWARWNSTEDGADKADYHGLVREGDNHLGFGA